MGYVIQEGGLFPHLTAAQNVTLMARHLQTFQENELQEKLDELCELTRFPKEGPRSLCCRTFGWTAAARQSDAGTCFGSRRAAA